jgi:hypothetical protein
MLQHKLPYAWPNQEAALAYLMWGIPPFSCAIEYGPPILDGQGMATDEKPQLDHPIQTMCVDLVNAAKELSAACRLGSDLTYGYMANTTSGSDSYPYLVALGSDYAFGSPRS